MGKMLIFFKSKKGITFREMNGSEKSLRIRQCNRMYNPNNHIRSCPTPWKRVLGTPVEKFKKKFVKVEKKIFERPYLFSPLNRS